MKRIFVFFIIALVVSACNPCRYVSKHPECFQPDSIIRIDTVVRCEIQTIKIDSIQYDTLPGVDRYIEKTIYLTKTVAKNDTIIKNNETIKLNPINAKLQAENEKLTVKNDSLKGQRNKLCISLLILVAFLVVYFVYLKRLF